MATGTDLFAFWHGVPGEARAHPLDQPVLDRVKHSFNTNCLLGPYMGRLKTAPIVFLFLSAGFSESDPAHGNSEAGRDFYHRQRSGLADLPTLAEHPDAVVWAQRILKQFQIDWNEARSKIAFLNISPYKSKTFDDWPMLSALPSCRAAVGWAQTVLFEQAAADERLVICLRSAASWGLGRKCSIPGVLVPKFTRNGTILLAERAEVVDAVQRKLRAS